MTSKRNERHDLNQKIISLLNKLEGANSSGAEESALDSLWEGFFKLLNDMDLELLPYGAVSQFIYKNNINDIEYFFNSIEDKIEERFKDTQDNVNYRKAVKLLEHLELANQQKVNLFSKQEEDIRNMESKINEINRLTSEVSHIKKEYENIKEDINQVTSSLISILGIFAAILIGAFGAIQSFSSLFSNAHVLSLGKLIIISSIGASSVIMILFFLLNGVAKLTGKRLWSTTDEKGKILQKYPIIVLLYCGLIFLALIGSALELSNIDIKFAMQGLWWLLPIIWVLICIVIFSEKTVKEIWEMILSNRNKS